MFLLPPHFMDFDALLVELGACSTFLVLSELAIKIFTSSNITAEWGECVVD